jgi:very-short-patch-repair endonuclease
LRGPKPETTQRARILRQSDNDAEAKLWSELRDRRLNGFKFVRQYPVGPYFADFACREKYLVVELDGSQHLKNARDLRRDAFMNGEGWSVVRFWNVDALTAMSSVLETIVAICDGRLTDTVEAPDLRFFPARNKR